MTRYRKLPVEIDAYQWRGEWPAPNLARMPAETDDEPIYCGYCGHLKQDHGWIQTMEGGHIVCFGDWIITGVQNEVYPCKPDIFAETYELVAPQAATD